MFDVGVRLTQTVIYIAQRQDTRHVNVHTLQTGTETDNRPLRVEKMPPNIS